MFNSSTIVALAGNYTIAVSKNNIDENVFTLLDSKDRSNIIIIVAE